MPRGSDPSQTKRAQIWFNLQQTGTSNRQIAKLHGVSEATVRRIRHSILEQLWAPRNAIKRRESEYVDENDCSHLQLRLS